MRMLLGGVVAVLVPSWLWTRQVSVDGATCGRAYDVHRGAWSPPYGRDALSGCLDAAVWPVRIAEGASLLGLALALVLAVVLLRRAWRSSAVVPQLLASASSGTAAAVLACWATLRLAAVPICPLPTAEPFVQCLAAGGGVDLASYPLVALVGLVVAGVSTLSVLLVTRAWRTRAERQGGWPACATS